MESALFLLRRLFLQTGSDVAAYVVLGNFEVYA